MTASSTVRNSTAPEVLWIPPPEARSQTVMGEFLTWLDAERGLDFPSYQALHRWSVDDLAGFYRALCEYFGISPAPGTEGVLAGGPMPGVRWFEGLSLNYAQRALDHDPAATALIEHSQTRGTSRLTFGELSAQVGAVQRGLRRLGVSRGDRVVGYLPNIPEAVALYLACAGLGAVFSVCGPEFGTTSVVARFGPLEPVVLVAVDGYSFRGKAVDKAATVTEIADQVTSLQHVVEISYLGSGPTAGRVPWTELTADPGEPVFAELPASHPLHILHSSGTTGRPKAIVQSHGGIVVEHLKMLGLHMDLRPGDVLLCPATTAWMVWNSSVSTLLRGATMVCFDGDPLWPDPLAIWQTVAELGVTHFSVGASLLVSGLQAGIRPRDSIDLGALRVLTSTGSPLPVDGFRWVYDAVKPSVWLQSASGGTDVCSAFVGGTMLLPVVAGEITCAYLGVGVEAFDEQGGPVRGREGELVITTPMPSMPLAFWDDPDGSRLRDAYFDRYPRIWRHGDWVEITERDTFVITGRSDATLNRGGVRLGTAEFYGVLDDLPEIADSLVLHLEDRDGGPGELVVLVSRRDPVQASDAEIARRVTLALRAELSPRHSPDTVHVLGALPRTLTGKRMEVPVKRVLAGADAADILSPDAVSDAASVSEVVALAEARR